MARVTIAPSTVRTSNLSSSTPGGGSLSLTYQRLDKGGGLREVWFLLRRKGEQCRQATRGEAQRTGSLPGATAKHYRR
jgi:hypothetical protein